VCVRERERASERARERAYALLLGAVAVAAAPVGECLLAGSLGIVFFTSV
jgi:hypothetical protein